MNAPLRKPPTLRLVREEFVEAADPSTVDVRSLQREIASLQAEVSQLRSKGDRLNFHLSRIDEELKLAARLQQDFLPKTLPQLGQVHFETLFRPASHVSGDFYDVIRLDETHIGFYIADAVGHGVPAALLTMFIKHALATKQIGLGGYRLLSASETMGKLNDTLIDQCLSAATFATAVYGIIDTATREVSFSRAGHPLPLVLRQSGVVDTFECDGGLLGVFENETYEQKTLTLNPGDRLLLFTDGVEVAFADDPELSQQRWMTELFARHRLPARTLLSELGALVDSRCTTVPIADDLTVMAVEVR